MCGLCGVPDRSCVDRVHELEEAFNFRLTGPNINPAGAATIILNADSFTYPLNGTPSEIVRTVRDMRRLLEIAVAMAQGVGRVK